MRKPWIGGNWKCNGTKASIEALATELNKADWDPQSMDVVISPTFLHIPITQQKLKNTFIVCAQNVSKTGNGAFTGEVSVDMLKDMGLTWTLIGHSERRQFYSESDEVVAAKVEACQKAGVCAAVCIGEVLAEREANKTNEVCKRQVEAFIPKVNDWSKVIIAYEPVWAIGTGKVATPEQAQDAHKAIRDVLRAKCGDATADSVRIAYGGSVTPDNCKTLISQPDVDGFLVGGASLKPTFVEIINSGKSKL